MKGIFIAVTATLISTALYTLLFYLLDYKFTRWIGMEPTFPMWVWAVVSLLGSALRVAGYAKRKGLFN